MKAADKPQSQFCAVGITVHRPDRPLLLKLLATLRGEGIPTFLCIDGSCGDAIEAALFRELQAEPALVLLQAKTNLGIGAALNALLDAVCAAGFQRILLFDQDSAPPQGLCHDLNVMFDTLEATGHRVAVLGPCPVAPEGEAMKPPRYSQRLDDRRMPAARTIPVDYVITSGSLVALDAWRDVGAFRAEYFIDGIDIEWCLRAWAKNFEVRLAPSLHLPHRLGKGILRLGPIAFPRQSETRMLSYVRNRMHMLRLAHVPRRLKLRTLVYLPLQTFVFLLREQTAPGAVKRFARAANDGWRGKLGPLPLNRT